MFLCSCNPCLLHFAAIKGKVRSIDEKGTWLHIKIDVKEIMKNGQRQLKKNDRLTFMKKASCDCPKITANTVDADFLIMGKNRGVRGNRIVMNNDVFVKKWVVRGPGASFYNRLRKELQKAKPCS